ncbi:MAG: M48 family metalloprotease [Dehalococcoidia bacterium]|jgi:heat shock protein HtpX|nr:M48 family metalloprotease [Dehalococcoidia bacterium]
MNNLKTAVLLAAISGLLIAVGGVLMGTTGVVMFAGLAVVMNVGSFWFSADLVLKMSKAQQIERDQDPQLFAIVEHVARRAQMPMPRVFVIDSPQPNAFATGRSPKHAAVAVTSGIRTLLSERELRGVLGHELAHVANRDILTSSIAATIASAISMIGWFGLFFGGGRRGGGMFGLLAVIVAPIAAAVIQMAISRAREYQADRDGARYVQDPEGLASALAKLEMGAQRTPVEVAQSTAHLYIVNPLRGGLGGGMAGLFSTHPPIEERVRRLREMRPDQFLG